MHRADPGATGLIQLAGPLKGSLGVSMPTPFRVAPRTLEEFLRALTLTATSAPSTDFCVAVELLIAMCVSPFVGLAERICSHKLSRGRGHLGPP